MFTCLPLISRSSSAPQNLAVTVTSVTVAYALTDHPTDILAAKPAGKYGYGMGSKFLGDFALPTPLDYNHVDLNFSDFEC